MRSTRCTATAVTPERALGTLQAPPQAAHATTLVVSVACAEPAVKSTAVLSTTTAKSRGALGLVTGLISYLPFSILLPPVMDYKAGLDYLKLVSEELLRVLSRARELVVQGIGPRPHSINPLATRLSGRGAAAAAPRPASQCRGSK